MAKKTNNIGKKVVKQKPPKDFSLMKAIRGVDQKDIKGESQLYKANTKSRDIKARKFIEEHVTQKGPGMAMPGQLIMFNYYTPKTREQLEYYDANPCTIFFGEIRTEEGPRILGFNIHYYPPRIRYTLLDRIFDIFKPFYLNSWNSPMDTEVADFNYKMLIHQLQKAKLDFGIRMYIPSLMGNIKPIPPKYWQKAVFSEGHFRKETREQILNYWKNKSAGITKKKK